MVYIYLVHYAEVEPEAALLAINTLKKELSNPNQLVRANALRTMSSIRVRIIAQLVGLAVKQASTDSSPYVRKAAAHAVPKLVRYVYLFLPFKHTKRVPNSPNADFEFSPFLGLFVPMLRRITKKNRVFTHEKELRKKKMS